MRVAPPGQQRRQAVRQLVIRRELASKRPDAFLADLAASLNIWCNRQSQLGQHEEALKSAQETAAIRHELASKCPEAFLTGLVTSLGRLGNILQ